MAGWNLKKGKAKTTSINDEFFWDRVTKFLSKKTIMKNN